MSSLEELSWQQLGEQLRAIQSSPDGAEGDPEKSRLVLELQAHQIELETQNRSLRESQARLEASRARYAELYDQAPVGYATVDPRGVIREINLTGATLLRTEREQLIGSPFSVIAGRDNVKRLFLAWRAVAGGGSVTLDVTRSGPGGPSVLEVKLVAREREWGERADAVQAVFGDVTELRRADAERASLGRERRSRAEAEAANHLKDEFLGIVSHELRTPLNALLGWIDILASHGSEAGALERGLTVMKRNGQSLTRLVDDILDVSRIVSGKLQVNLVPLAADEIVRNAVDQAREAAQGKTIELSQSIAPRCGARGDQVRLQQVVSNLLSNAIKFTGPGGHVDVTLERRAETIELRVSDDGCGIDPADLPHVFERFRQGDSSTKREHAGLGLGLAIARHIVEAHGGTIDASSPGRGQGAAFKVTLPAHDMRDAGGPEAVSTPVSVHGGPSIAGAKIVCVDDDPDTLELVALMLTTLGAAVRTAGSVGDAVALVESFNPDVVVSDVAMPVADGFDLVSRIRKLGPPCRDVSIVACTACARPEDEARAAQAGFEAFLAKPIDRIALAATIAGLLRRRAAVSSDTRA